MFANNWEAMLSAMAANRPCGVLRIEIVLECQQMRCDESTDAGETAVACVCSNVELQGAI